MRGFRIGDTIRIHNLVQWQWPGGGESVQVQSKTSVKKQQALKKLTFNSLQ